MIKSISSRQFAVFRIVFGTYLFVHFVQLIPYAGELFSSDGLLADPRLNFTFGFLPNPLEHIDTPGFVAGFLVVLAGLALMFAAGLGRRVCAVLLWYGWACLFNRNNLISNPGLPYIGLLLLLCALVPPGEAWRASRRPEDPMWRFPGMIYWSAWWLLAAGYTYSGVWKLLSPSWLDGSALSHVLHNPLARLNALRGWLVSLPAPLLAWMTWSALAGEVLALPLSFWRRGRMVAWTWMLAMHLGILFVVDFADLTLGMLMAHLFTADPDWLPSANRGGPVRTLLLYDGECALCNGWVKFMLRRDRAGVLRFAPLQGPTAARILASHPGSPAGLTTVVWVENVGTPQERIHVRSEAALLAVRELGGYWGVVSWLRVVPRFVRDAVYDLIARNRYRWFGKQESCLLPDKAVASRFLP